MSNVKFGWYEAGLVPEGKKVNLAGQFYERITDQVRDPLYVTALAVECGEEGAIFCACDLVSTSHVLLEKVRELLKDNNKKMKMKLKIGDFYVKDANERIYNKLVSIINNS